MLCGQSLIPFHFITSDPLVQETVTDSSRNCRFFTRCTGQNFSNQLILFFCCPYFVLIFMSKCFWTTSIFCTNPNPNCIMKAFFVYSVWCFWPFSLPVQFHTLSLVFITIFHRNTPNTGCPVLGVHIKNGCVLLSKLFGSKFSCGVVAPMHCVPDHAALCCVSHGEHTGTHRLQCFPIGLCRGRAQG